MTKPYPTTKKIEDVSSVHRVLGDLNRYKMLTLIYKSESGVCVQELADALEMTHSAVSHQLGSLFDMRIVSSKKIGRETLYSLTVSPLGTKVTQALELF